MDTHMTRISLLSRQFIVHRWRTPQGREVYTQVLNHLKNDKDVGEILEKFVLKHPANFESYDFPYYPPDAITEHAFWVLAIDDLRGIYFFNEDFSNSKAFVNLNLSYANFLKCNFNAVNFEVVELSNAIIDNCNLSNSIYIKTKCLNTKFINCQMKNSVFLESILLNPDFRGSNLQKIYFESTTLREITLNYLTKVDKTVNCSWHERSLPNEQLADIYKSFRLAYENAKLYSQSDYYFEKESVANRKYIVWKRLISKFSFRNFYDWFVNITWSTTTGYGAKPFRVLILGFFISLFYTLLYILAGLPKNSETVHPILNAFYLSFTTYSTLGYGDVTYLANRPWMRLLTTSEAWIGAVMIALFIVILSRKLLRR